MTKEEKVDFLISCAEDLEKDHNLEIWGIENLQECAVAFRDGAEALREYKVAHWEHHPFEGGYYCSDCNKGGWIYHVNPSWKACPWCGAKMEVENG